MLYSFSWWHRRLRSYISDIEHLCGFTHMLRFTCCRSGKAADDLIRDILEVISREQILWGAREMKRFSNTLQILASLRLPFAWLKPHRELCAIWISMQYALRWCLFQEERCEKKLHGNVADKVDGIRDVIAAVNSGVRRTCDEPYPTTWHLLIPYRFCEQTSCDTTSAIVREDYLYNQIDDPIPCIVGLPITR